MGFTSEISPALENLRLGVAVVRRSLYFQEVGFALLGKKGAGRSKLPYLTLQDPRPPEPEGTLEIIHEEMESPSR